jgi:methylthioribose-1-phosphate isomerase
VREVSLFPEQPSTITLAGDGWSVDILDQTALPHRIVIRTLRSVADMAEAIRRMRVRGAPLLGAAAAYGLALSLRDDPSDAGLEEAVALLRATRPTAVNLAAALDRVASAVRSLAAGDRAEAAYAVAAAICAEDVALNRAIGVHGLALLREWAAAARTVRVLTHCNAGYLATVDGGTALAPVYHARAEGLPVHVWVSETRPRGQGALTAWELARAGVPFTVIADSAAGHLMQAGRVDVCLVGTDRTTACGDVCNKIGTYLKALAAREHGIPFYACVPGPSIDWRLRSGAEIPIEERDGDELRVVPGDLDGARGVRLLPPGTPVANPAFDVTPARLLSGLITERGVCPASAAGLRGLYPERAGPVGAPGAR